MSTTVPAPEPTEPMIAGGRLPLKENGRTIFVPLHEVECLEASGNYVLVHAGTEQYLVREKLATFSLFGFTVPSSLIAAAFTNSGDRSAANIW